jgi:hypothetical protein
MGSLKHPCGDQWRAGRSGHRITAGSRRPGRQPVDGHDAPEAIMAILVTGSAGHLGEALMRSLRSSGRAAIGMDLLPSPFTRRPLRATSKRAKRRASIVCRLRRALRRPRMEIVPHHRPCLSEPPGQDRAGMATEVRLPPCARLSARRDRLSQPAGARDREQGLSRHRLRARSLPRRVVATQSDPASALGVAGPGADDAVLAAVLVALA